MAPPPTFLPPSLQLHHFGTNMPINEMMKVLHNLVQLGKVRYIGASSMCTWQFMCMNHMVEKNGWIKFMSMQCEYCLLYQEEVHTHHRCRTQKGSLTTPHRNTR